MYFLGQKWVLYGAFGGFSGWILAYFSRFLLLKTGLTERYGSKNSSNGFSDPWHPIWAGFYMFSIFRHLCSPKIRKTWKKQLSSKMGSKKLENRFFAPFWYFGATDDPKNAKNMKISENARFGPKKQVNTIFRSICGFSWL